MTIDFLSLSFLFRVFSLKFGFFYSQTLLSRTLISFFPSLFGGKDGLFLTIWSIPETPKRTNVLHLHPGIHNPQGLD